MKVIVDQDTCIGCEMCPAVCPSVLRMNSSGKAEVIPSSDADAVTDTVKEAVETCPVDAISTEE